MRDIHSEFAGILQGLSDALCGYLEQKLAPLAPDWWPKLVLTNLTPPQRDEVARRRISSLRELDLAALLRTFDRNWFLLSQANALPREAQPWIKEMVFIRNRWSHLPASIELAREDILRDLDTVLRVARAVGADEELLAKIKRLRGLVNEPPPPPPPPPAITKSEAINCMNAHYKTGSLNHQNVTFSNINSRADVWWMDIAKRKIQFGNSSVNLLLFNNRSGDLHHLVVPSMFLRANLGKLRDMEVKVRLHLSTDAARKFRNIVPVDSGVDFKPFLRATVKCGRPFSLST